MSNIWDGLRGFVSGLFAGKRKFRNIDLDEIRKERVWHKQTEIGFLTDIYKMPFLTVLSLLHNNIGTQPLDSSLT